MPAAEHHPCRILRSAEPALLPEIAGEHRPEVIADRHAMLIPRALQPHHDRARPTIQITEPHPQDPVLAVHRAPVPDPLTGPPQQRQQRPIALRAGRTDQPAPRPPARPDAATAWEHAAGTRYGGRGAPHHDQACHEIRPSANARPAPDRAAHPTRRTHDRGRGAPGSRRTTPTRTTGDSPSAADARAPGRPRSRP